MALPRIVLPVDHRVRYLCGSRTVFRPSAGLTAARAIRWKCLDCSGGSAAEVAACTVSECPLFPHRLGRRPRYRPDIDSGAGNGGFSAMSATSEVVDL